MRVLDSSADSSRLLGLSVVVLCMSFRLNISTSDFVSVFPPLWCDSFSLPSTVQISRPLDLKPCQLPLIAMYNPLARSCCISMCLAALSRAVRAASISGGRKGRRGSSPNHDSRTQWRHSHRSHFVANLPRQPSTPAATDQDISRKQRQKE